MTEFDATQEQASQSILLAMEQLISGERSIAEFRDEMLNVVYEHPAVAGVVRGLIDDYARRGLIPEQIHRLLSRDIDKATSEEMPTTPTEFRYKSAETGTLGDTTIGIISAGDAESAPVAVEPEAPSGPRAIEIGELLRERFEIIGRASGGSMGIVYKAIDRRLAEMTGGEPTVAIKVLAPAYSGDKGAMKALQQEAAKVRHLNHPHIVRFLDVDRSGEQVFLVMEWLDGSALSDRLAERPGQPMRRQTALDIVRQVGLAASYAHEAGVTHADIKPGNVMLLPDGNAKLLDFGIARARGNAVAEFSTDESTFLQAATPAFASPAVLGGAAAEPIDDVFSLACLAYRVLSGRRAFRDKTALQARAQHISARRIPGLESRYWKAIERGLSLDPATRTPTVDAFLTEMGLSGEQHHPRWRFYAGVAAVLGTLSVLAIVSPRWRSDPAPVPSQVQSVAVDAPDGVRNSASQDSARDNTGDSDRQSDRASSAPAASGAQRDAAIEIPIPEFLVTSAEWVTPDASQAAATLVLPMDSENQIPTIELLEEAGPLTVRLALVAVDEPVTVRLASRAASRSIGRLLVDHLRAPAASALVFDRNNAAVELTFENLPDATVEPDLDVTFDVLRTDDDLLLGRFVIRLLDDDRRRVSASLAPDTVSFAQDSVSVAENAGALSLTLWRLNPTPEALSVTLEERPMSATREDDYVAPEPAQIMFEPGQNFATVFVPIVSDSIAEGVELFRMTLQSAASIDGINDDVTVRILDAE